MIESDTDVLSVGSQDAAPKARLRILETTDLHMHLLGYDYFADKPDDSCGLIRLLDRMNTLRNEPGQTTLLFDNGDFIQGNPLADYLAAQENQGEVHPMINAFNVLDYDAITLGNHEFNYGLSFLRGALRDACFPVVCANITDRHHPPLADDFCIIKRDLRCDDGQTRAIKVGVTGFVTPQITQWDHDTLAGALTTEDIVTCAKALIPRMKAAGADLIVALCHSGIGADEHIVGMENAAVPLAGVAGIDVVLTGHTHETFPDTTRPPTPRVDSIAGTLHGKPAVMAGFYGNRLGVVDLELHFDGTLWRVNGQRVYLETGTAPTMATKKLRETVTAGLQGRHRQTLAHIRQPIATTQIAVHSYFATIMPDLSQQLLARAQRNHVAAALADTPYANLPVISATAPFLFGGRSGPGHYIDIAPGPLTLRDAVAIYPFANTLCAVRQTGAGLRMWLERAAAHFEQLVPGRANQSLITFRSPGYDYDMLDGLRYAFDLSRPARFDINGNLRDSSATRVGELLYAGNPVRDDDLFILAANSYRAYGGGNYPAVPRKNIVYHSTQSTRDILIADLRARRQVTDHVIPTWKFAHLPDTRTTFLSSPRAKPLITDQMQHLGPGEDGFDIYELTL